MTRTFNEHDVDKGWAWMVLLAVYSAVVIISTSTFMGGVLYVALLEEYGGDKAISTLIGSLNTGLLCLLGPFASVYMNMFSCRVSIVTGGLLVSLAYLMSAFVKSVGGLIFTFGILGGIGNTFVSTPLVVVLVYYFEKRRNTVISVSIATVGLGMFLASPMALAGLETYGLSGSFMILSGFNANICVAGVICRPSSVERRIYQKSRNVPMYSKDVNNKTNSSVMKCFKRINSAFNIGILRNEVFTAFMFSTLTWNLIMSVFLMHLPNYMVTQGATSFEISVIMTCFSGGNTLGRFLSAMIVDRRSINNFVVHIAALSLAGVVAMAFPSFSYANFLRYGFAGVSGIFTGMPNSLTAPILLEILGVNLLSTAHGLEYFFSGLGFILGPPIAGFLFSRTNTYENSFYFAGIVVIIGAILGTISFMLFRKSKREAKTADTKDIERENIETNDTQIETVIQVESVLNDQPFLEKS